MSQIVLAHGDGGLYSAKLIKNIFQRHLNDSILAKLEDAAVFPAPSGRMALTTDSFVVQPVVFPGGDIGKLSVCGVVNDLTAAGAIPLYMTAAFILEEGLPFSELEEITASMARTASDCGIRVVAGDTKVVPRGQADKLYISTTGIGQVHEGLSLAAESVKPGDAVLINGDIGDHSIAVISCREGLAFETPLTSDCAPLNGLLASISEFFPSLRWLRDPTRGGVSATLNELAAYTSLNVVVSENHLPFNPAAAAAAEMLGLDLLQLANEGKMVIVVDGQSAGQILTALRKHPLGRKAEIIGHMETGEGAVYLKTRLGGTRIVELPAGLPLPRIC